MTRDFAIVANGQQDARDDTAAQNQLRIDRISNSFPERYKDDAVSIYASDQNLLETNGSLVACGLVYLDNRAMLEQDFGSDIPSETSDLGFVLALYVSMKEDLLNYISGSFSFVIWDAENTRLLAGRDHFGVLPLYRTRESDGFVLSSDLKLAAHLSPTAIKPNNAFVTAYLAGFEDDDRQTSFSSLWRVRKSHYLSWTPGQEATEQRYWELSLPDLIDLKSAPEQVKQALTRSVKTRMRTDESTGCMLSGGLDSSSIAILAAEGLEQETLKTLSFVYRETDAYDESHFIKDVNDQIASDPVLIKIDGPPPIDRFPLVLEEQFDLCPAPGLLKSRQIYAEAHSNGLTALMDGHGGDEVISHGYTRQAEMATRGEYFALLREMYGASRVYGQPVLEGYLSYLHQFAPLKKRGLVRRAIGWLGRKVTTPRPRMADANLLFREEFRQSNDISARHKTASERFVKPEDPPNERMIHLQSVYAPLASRAFEVLRRSAIAQGVEPVYPFYDKALIQTCLSVPTAGKLRGGWSRRVLRDAMEGVLPKSIQWRPDKANFNTELAAFVVEYLGDPTRRNALDTRLDGIVDPVKFQESYEMVRDKDAKISAPLVQVIWRCIYYSEWIAKAEAWAALHKEGKLL